MIVVDTGPLVALASPNDSAHAKCRAWLDSLPTRRDLVVPATVVAEACYLTERFGGPAAEALFLEDLAAGAFGTVTGLMPEDLQRMGALVRQYASLPLGGTDASVVAVAERVKTKRVATLDRRHFTVVRTKRGEAFTLYPA
ncbi:type II toxin-antitoxin system VapC family toxin [Streptomyces malaysiensis]|uniref:type II toxin-antitoxin system VapC family toxin n=1 Tax=Streptomyces malaysiensis TaxID=92644 RepID=UPI000BFB1756|nr:PIN domain-containing protein [Streptomyces malaysiensis]ATL88779.1 PilT protein-like [Streptomyces malaysiensis]